MDRVIKFRVWDKEFKKWSETPLKYAIEDLNYNTDYEWNQFTGLKDRNGVEIYEGDIIRIFNDEDDYWEDEVSWHMSAFFSGDEDLLCNVHFRSEVIGNICEHPHLLEGVK